MKIDIADIFGMKLLTPSAQIYKELKIKSEADSAHYLG